jgi:hypothetical protein
MQATGNMIVVLVSSLRIVADPRVPISVLEVKHLTSRFFGDLALAKSSQSLVTSRRLLILARAQQRVQP